MIYRGRDVSCLNFKMFLLHLGATCRAYRGVLVVVRAVAGVVVVGAAVLTVGADLAVTDALREPGVELLGGQAAVVVRVGLVEEGGVVGKGGDGGDGADGADGEGGELHVYCVVWVLIEVG